MNTIVNTIELLDYPFLCSRSVYMQSFNRLPWISFIDYIDGEKAFEAVKQKHSDLIKEYFCYRIHERAQEAEFDKTLVVLHNNCVLEFDQNYCEVLHDGNDAAFVDGLIATFKPLKEKKRRKPLDINLVMSDRSLKLKPMEIKRTKLDLDLYYEDDFKQVDKTIRKRLNTKKDKGIVLLHGLPGTGKTTYLRYLVGKINKRVLFLSPNLATKLVEPEFVQLLIDNPDSVVVIEDAENIIMDRKISGTSAVSSLLNISDGLLADFLNVQLICTFNNSLTLIDSALMRKGRLIARYEFGKLGVKKAQRLSDHLGFDSVISKPMTLAEIANQKEMDQQAMQMETIGFRNN